LRRDARRRKEKSRDGTITPQNDRRYHVHGAFKVQGAFKLVTEGGRTIAVDGDETWLCRQVPLNNR